MPHHDHHHPHHHPHHRHNRDRELEALTLLLKSGRIKTVGELIACVKEMDVPGLAEFLEEFQRGLGAGAADLPTAVAAMRAHVGVSARGQHAGFLRDCHGRRVAMLFPLPPHVHEQFIELPNITLMVAPGHRLPPHLRRMEAIHDARHCRRILDQFDIIVFEGFKEDGVLLVDAGVADILDLRLVPVAAQLAVHLRPHAHPEDVDLDLGGRSITLL